MFRDWDSWFESNHFLFDTCGSYSDCDAQYKKLTQRIYSLPLLFSSQDHTFILLCGTRQQCICSTTDCEYNAEHVITDDNRRYSLVDVTDISKEFFPKTEDEYKKQHTKAVEKLKQVEGHAMILCLLNKLNVTNPLLHFYNMPPHALTCVWRPTTASLTLFDTSPSATCVKLHETINQFIKEMLQLPVIQFTSHWKLGYNVMSELYPKKNDGWCLLISWLVARRNPTADKLKAVNVIDDELRADLKFVFNELQEKESLVPATLWKDVCQTLQQRKTP